MEKVIKIAESDFQLFQTNNDFVTFISILRLCDSENKVDSTLSKLCELSKLTQEDVRKSLNNLVRQGLVSGNADGDILLLYVRINHRKWINGDVKKSVKKEELSEVEQKFRERLKDKFPRIASMSQPLLLSEYNIIAERYTQEQILDVMLQMENFAKLSNYVSAKLTLLNWIRRKYG